MKTKHLSLNNPQSHKIPKLKLDSKINLIKDSSNLGKTAIGFFRLKFFKNLFKT